MQVSTHLDFKVPGFNFVPVSNLAVRFGLVGVAGSGCAG